MADGARAALVLAALRTPRGAAKPGGGLTAVTPIELVATLLRRLEADGVDPAAVDDVLLGCVTQTGDQGADIAKVAALWAGWDASVSGATVNRFCASGLDAIGTAAARIIAGFDELIVAGGVESMSRVPMLSDAGAWFADPEVARVTGWVHMGVAADLLASVVGLTRSELDAYAARSHARAAAAWEAGRFRSVVPVAVPGSPPVTRDERIRPGVDTEQLAALPAPFGEFVDSRVREAVAAHAPGVELRHLHTVGTSPALVDAASAVVIGSRAAGERLGLAPRARVAAVAHGSTDPVVMLDGPAGTTAKALAQAGMKVGDVDLVECNESFAAVPLAFQRALGIDDDRLNVNGGAIAMGHPLGATGGILVGTLLDELEERDATVGVATIPGGAGVTMAVVLERL